MAVEQATILVVDDDACVARLEQVRLEQAGYQVVVTHTAADALARARAGDIDLGIIDLRLEGSVTGLDLIDQFQAAGLRFPVVIVTAFSEEGTIIRALRSGVADYIPKTAAFQDFLPEAAERVLRQSRTEMRLAESEARFASFMDNGPAYCFIKDEQGRFVFANRQLRRLYPAVTWEGNTVFDFLPPDLAQMVFDDDQEVLRNGQQSEKNYESTEPDGRTRHWVVYRFPMRDMYGRSLMGGVCVDITEHVRAEMALRATEAKFRAVSESATDAIIATDQYAQVISWNPAAARMFGFSAEEMIGHSLEQIVPERYREAQREGLARVMAHGPASLSSHPSELMGLRKDGSEFPIELSIGYWQDDEEMYFTGIVRDVTDRRRAEEELRKREEQLAHSQRLEALGTLAGGVAHEFNNLLQSILGYTQYAREGLDADDSRRQDLDVVLKAAERASTLTRQLLGFSRRQRLQYEDLDPNQMVREVAHLLRPLIGEHIRLELDLAEDAGKIHADAANLQQLLMNLAINARDAMSEGGRLLIRTQRVALDDQGASLYPNLKAGEFLRLVVSDTGCGMSSDVLEHAFEPFFTTKEVGRGTGLGLASVYGVVTQHQGAIHVESEPGEGTTLEILLPLVEGACRAAGVRADSFEAGGRETILLAEDEPLVRDLVVRKLEAAGYRVLAAQDGAQALEMFVANRRQIKLVILDVVMPRMGGREVYERMREIESTVKVIFASAYDAETAGLEYLERSGLRFIQKPAGGPTLLAAIREVLDAPSPVVSQI